MERPAQPSRVVMRRLITIAVNIVRAHPREWMSINEFRIAWVVRTSAPFSPARAGVYTLLEFLLRLHDVGLLIVEVEPDDYVRMRHNPINADLFPPLTDEQWRAGEQVGDEA